MFGVFFTPCETKLLDCTHTATHLCRLLKANKNGNERVSRQRGKQAISAAKKTKSSLHADNTAAASFLCNSLVLLIFFVRATAKRSQRKTSPPCDSTTYHYFIPPAACLPRIAKSYHALMGSVLDRPGDQPNPNSPDLANDRTREHSIKAPLPPRFPILSRTEFPLARIAALGRRIRATSPGVFGIVIILR